MHVTKEILRNTELQKEQIRRALSNPDGFQNSITDFLRSVSETMDFTYTNLSLFNLYNDWSYATTELNYKGLHHFLVSRLLPEDITLIPDTLSSDILVDFCLDNHNSLPRFVVIITVRNNHGQIQGYFSAMDAQPRTLTSNEIQVFSKAAIEATKLINYIATDKRLASAEKKIKYDNEFIHTMIENSLSGKIIINQHGVITNVNNRASEIFGSLPTSFIGAQFSEIVIPYQFREQFEAYLMKATNKADDNGDFAFEFSRLDENSFIQHLEMNISSETFSGNRIASIRDITKQKVASEHVSRQKEFYETILNNIPSDIAVFDKNHRYIFVNPGGIKNPELRKAIIGLNDFEYCELRKRDSKIAETRHLRFLEAAKNNSGLVWEDTIEDNAGRQITHLRRFFPVKDDSGNLKYMIGYGVDITNVKEMENKQKHLVSQLSIQNEQLTDFTNIIAHNLRAPLTNISAIIDFISQTENMNEKQDLISYLRPAVNNLSDVFSELVESLMIRNNKELKFESINIAEAIDSVINNLKKEIIDSRAIFTTNLTDETEIWMPQKHLATILRNVLSNCLKFKHGDRQLHITISTESTNEGVLLSIKDNGSGFDSALYGKSLFKIGKVFHKNASGKGFGLFLTKALVDSIDGKISAESTLNEGTTMNILIKKNIA